MVCFKIRHVIRTIKSHMRNPRLEGTKYEDQAALYLEKAGYRVIARNVTYKFGEIDIVAEAVEGRARTLVFVEVRKRGNQSFIRAEESVTYKKERRLRSAIQLFLLKYQGQAKNVRIDLIAFQNDEVRHFPNFI